MKPKNKTECIEVGYAVAVSINKGYAPLCCYVGEVQCVDEHGVRITLADWMVGAFLGFDLFIPWESINAMLVATKDHDIEEFMKQAGEFQTKVNLLNGV